MTWRPNPKLGYAMWCSARCCVCDAAAHYTVGRKGFCKRHRALAFAARAAAQVNLEINNAIGQRARDDADKAMKKRGVEHRAIGKRHRGFK